MLTPVTKNLFAHWYRGLILSWLLIAGLGVPSPVAAESTNSPGTFNIEAQTRAYLDRMSPAERARSNVYFEGGYWLILWDYLAGAVISIFLLQTRFSAKMRDVARCVTRFKPVHTFMYAVFYIGITSALALPLGYYEGFIREHQYGMATQTPGEWFGDWGKSFAVSIVIGGLMIVVLFGVVRKLPRTWHIWGSVVTLIFLVFGLAVTPVFIAPLFNKYTPLEDPKVVAPILSLARANGITADKVYVMDASKQTTKVSANVSGFLGTMRITLNDNLLHRSSLPEIEAVMGHEMGHYVLNHIPKMIISMGIIIVLAFVLLRWALEKLLATCGPRWGIEGIGDPAVLPLVLLVFSTYMFILTPVMNTMVRTQEIEADMYGLNAARQPDGFAEAALKLGEYRKMEPTPFEEFVFFDHPSGANRIRAAMRWKAENLH